MIHTFTYTTVKPPGTRRTFRSNLSKQPSGEYSDLIVFRQLYQPACASGLHRAPNRYSMQSTLTYVNFISLLARFLFIYDDG